MKAFATAYIAIDLVFVFFVTILFIAFAHGGHWVLATCLFLILVGAVLIW